MKGSTRSARPWCTNIASLSVWSFGSMPHLRSSSTIAIDAPDEMAASKARFMEATGGFRLARRTTCWMLLLVTAKGSHSSGSTEGPGNDVPTTMFHQQPERSRSICMKLPLDNRRTTFAAGPLRLEASRRLSPRYSRSACASPIFPLLRICRFNVSKSRFYSLAEKLIHYHQKPVPSPHTRNPNSPPDQGYSSSTGS